MFYEPIINEEELNIWLFESTNYEFSPSVGFEEWDEEYIHPKKMTLSVTYKMGDGHDYPYYEYPPDDRIIETLKKNGWKYETDDIMHYPHLIICPKCGIVNANQEEVEETDFDEENLVPIYLHKKCGTTTSDIIVGSKWIYGTKTIPLKGTETPQQIKQLILKELKQTRHRINICTYLIPRKHTNEK